MCLCSLCVCLCVLLTFSLRYRAVGVPQRQQGHFCQLIKQQIPFDQHELSVLVSSLCFHRTFLTLHHTEHRQEGSWGTRRTVLAIRSSWTCRGISSIWCFYDYYYRYCDQVPLECQLAVVGCWVGQGLLGKGLPCLVLSGVEVPELCCSSRAILAGGGREFAARSLDSVFLIPSHSGSICGFTLLRQRCLNIRMNVIQHTWCSKACVFFRFFFQCWFRITHIVMRWYAIYFGSFWLVSTV